MYGGWVLSDHGLLIIVNHATSGFSLFPPHFQRSNCCDHGLLVEKQLNRKSLLNIFSVYQQAIELVVMLIVFDRISSFLSIHTGVTYY